MDESNQQLADLQQQVNDHEDTIAALQAKLDTLHGTFYQNNFASSQDFAKYSRFNSRLKIPVNTSLPATCHIGEVCSSSGKLYVCSAVNTWTVAGSQS